MGRRGLIGGASPRLAGRVSVENQVGPGPRRGTPEPGPGCADEGPIQKPVGRKGSRRDNRSLGHSVRTTQDSRTGTLQYRTRALRRLAGRDHVQGRRDFVRDDCPAAAVRRFADELEIRGVAPVRKPLSNTVPEPERDTMGQPRLNPWRLILSVPLSVAVLSCLSAQPANDSCASPGNLVLGSNLLDTTLATTDGPILSPPCTEEPVAGGFSQIFNDVWFRFVPTTSGTLLIDTCSLLTTHPDTAIAVYGGLTCPPTVLVGCADEGPNPVCPGADTFFTITVVASQQYLVRLGGFANGDTGAVELTLTMVVPDPNDDCVDQIPVFDGLTNFDSSYASTDGAPLIPAVCNPGAFGDDHIRRDLWFTYTATQTGMAQVSTCNITNWDTRLAVYSSTACPADSNNVIACNDDGAGCAAFSSALVFSAVVSQTYLIRVGGFDGADAGPGQLDISYVPGLFNDNCQNALPLVVGDNPFDSTLATTDGPSHASAAVCMSVGNELIERDVWFEFVAPQDGLVEMNTCVDPGFDSQVAAYPDQSCPVDPLSVITCNDDDASCGLSGLRSTIRFLTTMGTTYIIRVGGFSDFDGGPGVLRVLYVPRPIENLTCAPTATDVTMTWALPVTGAYGDSIRIYENGLLFATIASGATSFNYVPLAGGNLVFPLELCVTGVTGGVESPITCCALDCAVPDLACTFDCVTDSALLTWSANPVSAGYEIFRNGQPISAVLSPTQLSFMDATPGVGAVDDVSSYEVLSTCVTGVSATVQCDLDIQDPAPAQHLVLALERVPGPGAIDSAAALVPALMANGVTVTVLDRTFDDFDCFPDLVNAAEAIWVLTGTFPEDYRLSAGEADLLASLQASGKPMYFESGDHWGFAHVASNLNARDGVDEGATDDGNDSLTLLDGQGPLASFAGVDYSQDQAGNDFTDMLAVSTTDPVTTTVLWRNSDDMMMTETDYIVGVLAEHGDGGRMISCSWEFGGFALDVANPSLSDPDRAALAAAYLNELVPTGTEFIRGNCNGLDASVNIADAIYLLGALFPGMGGPNPTPCRDACDCNDDGQVNIADAVALLGSLFGTPATPLPSPNAAGGCGLDPTDMDPLDCATAPPSC